MLGSYLDGTANPGGQPGQRAEGCTWGSQPGGGGGNLQHLWCCAYNLIQSMIKHFVPISIWELNSCCASMTEAGLIEPLGPFQLQAFDRCCMLRQPQTRF